MNDSLQPRDYFKVNAKVSEYRPTQNEISKPAVLIYSVNTKDSDAKIYNLDAILKSELEGLLSESRNVKLVKRNAKTSIADEIKLSQRAKVLDTDLNEANYLIDVTIESSTYTDEYEDQVNVGKVIGILSKGLKGLTKPSDYKYKACVVGKIKIIKIPEDYVVSTLPFNTCVTRTSYEKEDFKKEMLTEAVREVVNDVRVKLLNIFTQKGFVYEVRKKGSDVILKTSLGSDNGAKEGLEVNIYTIKVEKNPLTGKEVKSVVKIGKGVISDNITSQSSYVIVEDLKEEVKIGDYVRPVYQETVLDKVKRLIR